MPKPFKPAKNEKILASELYTPLFGKNLEGFVAECADGNIVAIVLYGREVIGKSYFPRKPIVYFEAPRERLKLLTVAGRPAIADLGEFSGTLRLGVIERFPKGNKFGILVTIDETFKTLEETAKMAEKMMGVSP